MIANARRISGTQLLAAWSARAVEARSRRAATLLIEAKSQGATAALLYGTNFFPAEPGRRAAVPVGAAMDATFAQLARSGEGWFARLTPLEVAACVERQRRVFEQCDWIFPRSEWCARSVADDYKIPPSRIVVTGAGANIDEPVPERKGYDGETILFAGRDWNRKNGPLVLSAFSLARRVMPELKCIIVGPSAPAGGAAQDGVLWLGPLDGKNRARLLQLYSEASLFVFPSRFEPFGVVLLEAMTAGCPVITLDRCAAPEIVVNRVTGTRLAGDEPHSLAEAMLYWLSDRERLAAAGRAARERVARFYTWDIAARRIVNTFEGRGETWSPIAVRSDKAAAATSENTVLPETAREETPPPREAF